MGKKAREHMDVLILGSPNLAMKEPEVLSPEVVGAVFLTTCLAATLGIPAGESIDVSVWEMGTGKAFATVAVGYDMVLVAVVALVVDWEPVHSSSGIRSSTGTEMEELTTLEELPWYNPMNEGGTDGMICPSKNTIGTRPSE